MNFAIRYCLIYLNQSNNIEVSRYIQVEEQLPSACMPLLTVAMKFLVKKIAGAPSLDK